jgi:hypothetical protein
MTMKKSIIAILSVMLLINAGSVFASMYNTQKKYYASGSTEGYVIITANTGTRICIDSILANSDLSTSVLKIYEGNPTQSVVADYDIGTGSVEIGNGMTPVYLGSVGFSVKVGVTSTTKNSVIVNWHRE